MLRVTLQLTQYIFFHAFRNKFLNLYIYEDDNTQLKKV